MTQPHYIYKYSVIIPHHETPNLLKRCVESIPERQDLEIIVVDDNSNENELYLKRYAFLRRERLTYIPTKEGKGGGFARNVGLDHAKGQWLLFPDADDFYTEGAFDVIDRELDEDIDVLYYNIKPDKAWQGKFDSLNKRYSKYLADGNDLPVRFEMWQPWNKVISSQVVRENKLRYEEVPVGNDALFCLKVSACAKRFKIIQDELYHYMMSNPSSITLTKMDFDREMLHLSVRVRINEFYVKEGLYKQFLVLLSRGTIKKLWKSYGLKNALIYIDYIHKHFGLIRFSWYRLRRRFA